MTVNIQTQILEAEAQVDSLKKEMGDIKQEFKANLIPFVVDWYKTYSKDEVSKKPDLVKQLGVEELRVVKARVNELIEKVPERVDFYMDNDALWWHLREETTTYLEKRKISDKIEKEVKYLLAEVAEILAEYGFVIEEKRKGDILWAEFQDGKEVYLKPRYPYFVTFPKELEDIYAQYVTRVDRAQITLKRIRDLKEEQKVSEAGDLWESL
ncbi:hypothetical protein [Priestia megaterium]|uniref:hypothetical protein n=1 Tax=Priestia megaterium TaxID=1404 RepID=UPI0028778224|nr:hypothetical protein [Priestia megaterium]